MITHNINCKQNDEYNWCKDKRVKRSLFGIGARVCCVSNGEKCPYYDPYPKPNNPPPPCPIKKDLKMPKPYVKVVRWGCFNSHYLEMSNGETTWSKNLVELTSYIGVSKNKEEANKCKQSFCDSVSDCIGVAFTIDDLDKIVTKEDYLQGMYAFREYVHIVETNIECVKQGKEPKYLATSIIGSKLIKELFEEELLEEERKDA